jgi:hypothetical protein
VRPSRGGRDAPAKENPAGRIDQGAADVVAAEIDADDRP